MRKALALLKVYLNSLYGFSGLIDDFKKDKKAAFKKLSLFLLIMFSFSSIVVMVVLFNINLYKALASINQQGVIITTSILMATMFVLVFGIITTISTYFIDSGGDIILSMPFENWNILFAKFAASYVSEFLIAFIIMSSGCIVYGVMSGEGPLFYIAYLLITLLVPIIPLVISYFLIIPLMKAGSFLKNKDIMMLLSGVIGIVFAIGYQFIYQSMFKLQQDQQALISMFASPDGLVGVSGRIYYPSIWGTHSIINPITLSGVLGFAAFLALSAGVLFILLYLMSGIYYKTLIGSGEVTKSRKSVSDKELKGSFRKRNITLSLLGREIKLMNREPVFFLNGPLAVILMPVLLFFIFFIQGDEMMRSLGFITGMKDHIKVLITAGIGAWMGLSTSITSTCVSREGKMFLILKSMPIKPIKYVRSKLLHGLIFGVLGSLIIGIFAHYILNISLVENISAFIMSIIVQLPLHILGILIELKWPKLVWDNPQKPMKQNINSLIIILGTMMLIPMALYLIITYIKNPVIAYLIFTGIPGSLFVVLQYYLNVYAEKRFYEIEM